MTARARISYVHTSILLGSILVSFGCTGFLLFLWFGTVDNTIWHAIIANNWASRAITLTSVTLRTAIAAQHSLCLSMIAAIALELSAVPLTSVSDISMMRASGDTGITATALNFAWPLLRSGPRLKQLILPSTIFSMAIMALSQFISTALFSDAATHPFPGLVVTTSISYDFQYRGDRIGYNSPQISSKSLWESSPPSQWPAFAEYAELPEAHENVSDTGRSLRAFLPLDARERQGLRNYTGKALVLDSRVICQRPILTNTTPVLLNNTKFLSGTVSPSVLTPRLDSPGAVNFTFRLTTLDWSVSELIEQAISGIYTGSSPGGSRGRPGGQFSGGLVSEFREFPPRPSHNKSGAALLVFSNVQVPEALPASPVFTRVDVDETHQVAITLCHTSFDTADRWINAYGDANRTEPTLRLSNDIHGKIYDVTEIAAQLYTDHNQPDQSSQRGVMSFQPPENWALPPSSEPSNDGPAVVGIDFGPCPRCLPFITDRLHLRNFPLQGGNSSADILGNYTATFTSPNVFYQSGAGYVPTELWLSALFDHFIANHSVSTALQAVITTLARIEYYQRIGQFDKSDDVSLAFFEDTYTPGGPFGRRRDAVPWGLTAVLALLALSTGFVLATTVRFILQVRVSRIGDGWQAMAQVALSDVEGVQERMRNAVDSGTERSGDRDPCLVKLSKETGVICLVADEAHGTHIPRQT